MGDLRGCLAGYREAHAARYTRRNFTPERLAMDRTKQLHRLPVTGGDYTVAEWAGQDTPLLAIHGITASHMAWPAVLGHLDRDYRVLAPDLRGRGASSELPAPYGFATHVEDLRATLDHFGVARAVLCGHSLGAYISLAFAERYPKSTFSRDALLTGSQWSTAMAYEENTIFFKERFLTAFARDEEAPVVRDQLLSLYLGRELYAQALQVLSRVAKDSRSDGPTRASAFSQMLRIEEQHGSLERATAAADQLLAVPGVSNELLAQGYGFKARFFAKSASWNEVDRIESRLAGLGD